MKPVVRKAVAEDLDEVCRIYGLIHDAEESGAVTVGWRRGVYPTQATATDALARGELFVMQVDGRVVASAIINHEQPEAYLSVEWKYPAPAEKVGVLHTLVVDPSAGKRGLGREFVSFFETYIRNCGCEVARLDTQVKNVRPFNLYPRLGYRLAAIAETPFQNLPERVDLAMFEKKL